MTDGEFFVNGKFIGWNEMTDEQQLTLFRFEQSQAQRFREERNYLRTLLLSQSGRTGEEIDRIKFGW